MRSLSSSKSRQGLTDGLEDQVASEDPFDEAARLWLATTENGMPVGTVRGLQISRGFPHRELFEATDIT